MDMYSMKMGTCFWWERTIWWIIMALCKIIVFQFREEVQERIIVSVWDTPMKTESLLLIKTGMSVPISQVSWVWRSTNGWPLNWIYGMPILPRTKWSKAVETEFGEVPCNFLLIRIYRLMKRMVLFIRLKLPLLTSVMGNHALLKRRISGLWDVSSFRLWKTWR